MVPKQKRLNAICIVICINYLQVSGREVFEFRPELVDDDDDEADDTRYADEEEEEEEEVIMKFPAIA